jgi:hypothetical protein
MSAAENLRWLARFRRWLFHFSLRNHRRQENGFLVLLQASLAAEFLF